jgi:hypothetical protein
MESEKEAMPEEPCPPWGWEHTRLLIIWVTVTIAGCSGATYALMKYARHVYETKHRDPPARTAPLKRESVPCVPSPDS